MGVEFCECALVGSFVMLSRLDLVLLGCTCLDLPSSRSVELGDNKVHLVAGGDVSRSMCVFLMSILRRACLASACGCHVATVYAWVVYVYHQVAGDVSRSMCVFLMSILRRACLASACGCHVAIVSAWIVSVYHQVSRSSTIYPPKLE